ncbi:MAG TPA: branched-chain amino acid ABC transporter permease, partial [Acidimicrobiales bacterium]|nr:branched-chain amino acid ABC transporter permease [Acidimicrobiales bacterium]
MPLGFLINSDFFNWTLIAQLFVNGMKNGAIYALMALTVVIIYKTTGHLNFAQGEMGTLGAFIIFVMVVEHGWSYWMAIPVSLVFSFLLGAGIERTLIRPIERRSALGVVIVTLGIFLVINALNAAIWGTQQLSPLTPFPNLPTDQWVIAEGPPRFAIRYGALGTWITLA